MLQVVHNRGHGFSKRFKPCRGAPKFPHAPTPLLSDQVGTRSKNIHPTVSRRGFGHDVSQTQSKHGGHPTKQPATKLAGSETDPGFASVAVNDWEPESVTGLVDT